MLMNCIRHLAFRKLQTFTIYNTAAVVANSSGDVWCIAALTACLWWLVVDKYLLAIVFEQRSVERGIFECVSLFCLSFRRATQHSSVYRHACFFDDNFQISVPKSLSSSLYLSVYSKYCQETRLANIHTTKHTAAMVRKNRSFSLTDHSVV